MTNEDYLKAIQLFLKQSNALFCLSATDHRFLACSERTALLCGFTSTEEMIGKTNHDLRCEAAVCADIFEQQDDEVLKNNQTMTYFAIMKYADGKDYLLLTEKSIAYDLDGTILGILSHCHEVNNQSLIEFASRLTKFDRDLSHNRHSGAYKIVDHFIFQNLSDREQEVLFFMIRGKSAREISDLLNLSSRTIETHINNMKNKLNLSRKNDIIEYAIEHGFLMIIPRKFIGSNIVYRFTKY